MAKLQKLKQYPFPISNIFTLVIQTHKDDLHVLQQE